MKAEKNYLYEALQKPIEKPTGIRKVISDNFIAEAKAMQDFIKYLRNKK